MFAPEAWLALLRVADATLEQSRKGLGPVSAAATLRNAVSIMLETGADALVVVGDDGAELGTLTLKHATELLHEP